MLQFSAPQCLNLNIVLFYFLNQWNSCCNSLPHHFNLLSVCTICYISLPCLLSIIEFILNPPRYISKIKSSCNSIDAAIVPSSWVVITPGNPAGHLFAGSYALLRPPPPLGYAAPEEEDI